MKQLKEEYNAADWLAELGNLIGRVRPITGDDKPTNQSRESIRKGSQVEWINPLDERVDR
jgi:hypothetical protein